MNRLAFTWPDGLVCAVRTFKAACAWFSEHTLLGVPLDWPLRAVLVGGLYALLRRRGSRRRAVLICSALLVAKELFDVFATRHPLRPPLPDAGDLADLAAGLVGLLVAESLFICCYPRGHGRRRPDD